MKTCINGNCLKEMPRWKENSIDSIVTDPPYGLKFMGKEWDKGVPGEAFWKEALRVAKPGAHLLAFGGTRTHHRLMVAIEDAGWEIRDVVMWIFGSGFPKSHNIGKAIQKIDPDNTEWEGWGTALKPAYEPIILARKPFKTTVAKNVLEYGTGGLNIDESRVPFEDTKNAATNPKYRLENGYKLPEPGQESQGAVKFTSSKNKTNPEGRFPANLILDEEAGEDLDKQTEGKVGNGHWAKTKVSGYGEFGGGNSTYEGVGKKDKETGGASRFFYCAKASKKDRNEGLEHLENKEWRDEGACIPERKNRPFNPSKNNHPTVKPTELMKYLIKLITPKDGIVLDPFMGSGSTGKAAVQLGFNFIGIELEEDYCKLAEARINESMLKM